jgi:surfactin synthase thioesterase subunit
MYTLSNNDFLSELKSMNGIASEILEHEELLELMLPIIRNDYQLCETYKFNNNSKLNIPFHIFGGLMDKDVSQSCLESWQELTFQKLKLDLFNGDHFFIIKQKNEFSKRFFELIENDLKNYEKFTLG